jgi:hypothetical protein
MSTRTGTYTVIPVNPLATAHPVSQFDTRGKDDPTHVSGDRYLSHTVLKL